MIHRCKDESEGAPNPKKAAWAKKRYWSNPAKYRAIALRSYYKHHEKNKAAARSRMKKTEPVAQQEEREESLRVGDLTRGVGSRPAGSSIASCANGRAI